MSASPIGMPGLSTPVLTLPEAPLPSSYAVTRTNEDAVQALIDRAGLPARRIEARPDVVYVLLEDVDDLAPWVTELDGRLRIGPTAAGLEEWTLNAELAATRRRGPVRVEVCGLAVAGQYVLPSLREAASR